MTIYFVDGGMPCFHDIHYLDSSTGQTSLNKNTGCDDTTGAVLMTCLFLFFCQPFAYGIQGCLRAVREMEFIQNAAHIFCNRALVDR